MLLLSLVCALIAVFGIFTWPILSYLILASFSFYFIKKRILLNPLSSIFCICYNLLFIIGVIIQFIFDIPFEDKFGAFSDNAITLYHTLSISFLFVFLITILVLEKLKSYSPTIRELKFTLSNKGIRQYIVIASSIMIIATFLFVIENGGFSKILTMSRVELGSGRGYLSVFGLYLAYIVTPMYFLMGLLLGNINYKGALRKLILSCICILFALVIFAVFRIRTFFVTQIFALFFGYIVALTFVIKGDKVPSIIKKELPFFKYAMVAVTFFSLLIILRFQRGAIGTGHLNAINMNAIRTMIQLTVMGGDLGYHFNVLRIIEFSWSGDLLVTGDSYLRLLTAFIPSSILDGKPIDTQIIIGGLFNSNLSGLTVPPGIIGDSYLNLGNGWLFSSIIIAAIMSKMESKRSATAVVFFGVCFSTMFHFTRGSISNTAIIFTSLYIGSFLFVLLSNIKNANP